MDLFYNNNVHVSYLIQQDRLYNIGKITSIVYDEQRKIIITGIRYVPYSRHFISRWN